MKKNTDIKALTGEQMAWNEPGDSKDKDPWGGRNNNEGPPDLDEVVKKLQEKFGGLFGGGKTRGDGAGGTSGPGMTSGVFLVVILAVLWLVWDSAYIVEEAERGVVLRFGQYVHTMNPGLNFTLPRPVGQVIIVNIDQIRNVEIGYRSGASDLAARSVPREALMLTQDENIIDIKFAIQYRVKDAKDYLFNVYNPDTTLQQATESAVREVIGKSKMDFVLTEGRSEIVSRSEQLIQAILDRYGAGLQITSVNMQDAQPPEQVQAAFSDAVKAREDEVRQKNEAETYSNDILPKARGKAARMLEEANAYKAQVVAEAEGEASRFTQILSEYKKAPEVTRERLYLDAIESVLTNSSKVMMDVEKSGNLMLLPLDKLMQRSGSDTAIPLSNGEPASQQPIQRARNDDQVSNERARSNIRSREVR